MVKGNGTARPYVSFIGNSAVDVTGSMHLIRFKKYVMLFDCGLIQLNDPMTSYTANQKQLKKVKPREIDFIILSHAHIDHSGMIPALFAKGCQAHVYVPKGATEILRLLWADSQKIMESDCIKLKNKHNINATPFYTPDDIERALNRCIEVDYYTDHFLTEDMHFQYYPSGHIVYSAQIVLTLEQGSVVKRIGYTGDLGGTTERIGVTPRRLLPFVDLLIGENTYNSPSRPNKASDRLKDIEKIYSIINSSQKILIPCFSLGRTQELLDVLYTICHLWYDINIPIYLDSPLSEKICNIYDDRWFQDKVMKMPNLHIIHDWAESQVLQNSTQHCIILSASGFLTGGRVMSHLKTLLPDKQNHLVFVGYAGDNNLASLIKSNQKEVNVDGELVQNNANITELRSFSSHASYEELIEYYTSVRFNKLALVHGEYANKPKFCETIQDVLHSQGKSAKVVCVNEGTKIYL